MEIEIVKNRYGSLFATHKESCNGLFQFEYRNTEKDGGPAWYFWLRGNYNPNIFKGGRKDFPMDFFINAVKAKAFILLGIGLDEDVNIVNGTAHLKK